MKSLCRPESQISVAQDSHLVYARRADIHRNINQHRPITVQCGSVHRVPPGVMPDVIVMRLALGLEELVAAKCGLFLLSMPQ